MTFSNNTMNLGRVSPFLVARDTPLPPIPDIDEDEVESMEYDSSASESDLDRRLSDRLESLRLLEGGAAGTRLEDVKEEDADGDDGGDHEANRNKPLPQTPLFSPMNLENEISPSPSINSSSVFKRRSSPARPGTPPKFLAMFSSPPPVPAFPPPPPPSTMDSVKSDHHRAHVSSSPFGTNSSLSLNSTPTSVVRRSPSPPLPPHLRSSSIPGSRTQHFSHSTAMSPSPANTTPLPTGNANAPVMVRAHSSPGMQSSPIPTFSPSPLYTTRSSSPLRSSASPKRVRSPFRNSIAGEEMLHSYASGNSIGSGGLMLSPEISSISEDAELEIFPRASRAGSASGPVTSSSATFQTSGSGATASYSSQSFPRVLRRRPASPLRPAVASTLNMNSNSTLFGTPSSSTRASSVPASPHPQSAQAANAAKRFNETFVSDLPPTISHSASHSSLIRPSSSSSHHSALSFNSTATNGTTYTFPSFHSSSVPSTPTSARSRSPSISSLETIPDTPDAEAQAVEQDKTQREERKRLWDQLYGTGSAGNSGSLKALVGAGTQGTGFAARDKRKRWSVCGAEKRGDLNLETIWED